MNQHPFATFQIFLRLLLYLLEDTLSFPENVREVITSSNNISVIQPELQVAHLLVPHHLHSQVLSRIIIGPLMKCLRPGTQRMADFQALALRERVSEVRQNVVFEIYRMREIGVDLRVSFFVEEE